jgi:3-phosphoshikimate 1-carboxyvinyltransferase
MKINVKPGFRSGMIAVPASKSDTQRALICAGIAEGVSIISNIGCCDDEQAVLQIIKDLGAEVQFIDQKTLQIKGVTTLPNNLQLNVGESGLATRLIIGLLSCYGGRFTITGKGTLLKRPLSIYADFFQNSGVLFNSSANFLPVELEGKLERENLLVDGSESSQYISGILLGLPFLSPSTCLKVINLASKPYVEMTLKTLKAFGIEIENDDFTSFKWIKPTTYKATNYTIESDWSAASCWLVAAALGADIQLKGLSMVSKQADIQILRALEQANCFILNSDESIFVDGSNRTTFEFDATDCPDLFPALTTLAAFTEGISKIKGVNRLTTKESSRGEVLQAEYSKLGVHIELQDDCMLIHGQSKVNGGEVSAHHDHRIAMCFAIAGMFASETITIEHAEAVSKSYPEFWEHFEKLTLKM